MNSSVRFAKRFPSSRLRLTKFLSATVGLGVALAGCRAATPPGADTPTMEFTTSEFQEGAIPRTFTCDGADISPALAWGAPPEGTRSFALTVVDIDAPVGSFVHWVLFDVPPLARALPEGALKQEQLPDGSRQGMTDFDKVGYGGPCPPGTSPHRYVFSLYAVDGRLNLPASTTRKQLEKALRGHVLAHGELIGKYTRQGAQN
jgi:Raf kinase inhibitor-like YbhB/YbcL family protein